MNRTITLAVPMAVPDTQQEVLARALRVGLRTALGVLGDREAAAEVAQEVAIVAFRRHGSLRDPQALDGWLYLTAVRAALREAKRSRTRQDAERAAAVHDDGSFAAEGWTDQPKRSAEVRRAEMTVATTLLIVESNATPELRAAGFGVLERLGNAKDLRHRPGRRGARGARARDQLGRRPARRRALVLDPDAGEILGYKPSGKIGDERNSREHTYLRAERTRSIPRDVGVADG